MSANKKIFLAIKQRDNKAIFTLLYQNYYTMVKAIVKKYNGSNDDADDVFQEMLIILIREIENGRIDEQKDLKNYLYTIAKNLYLNILKKQAKQQSLDDVPESLTEDMDVKSHIELQQSETLILDIIKQLGNTCYELLKAIIFENKKQEEIAKQLGLSDSNVVKTYKNRCKNKLITLLQNKPKLSLELLRKENGFGKYINVTK
jgi:RNA polymerase sigma factor (sigma-70 family)